MSRASGGGRGGPLQVVVADLLRRPGEQRPVDLHVPLDDLRLTSAWVEPGDEVEVQLTLESILGGLTATGVVGAHWHGTCRRCLGPVEGEVEVEIREVFAPGPTDDDLLPIDGDRIDLEPLAREGILLGLPLAPLCADDCLGPAPEVFPATVEGAEGETGAVGTDAEPAHDPRWAALDDLRFDE